MHIIKAGKNSKGEPQFRTQNIKMLGEIFGGLLKGEIRKLEEPSRKQPYQLFKYCVFTPSIVPGLDNLVLKLPATHAYTLDILDTVKDLKIYLNAISDKLRGVENGTIKPLTLSKEQKKVFESLYTNPFKFPYSKANQPVSNGSIPIYHRNADNFDAKETFSDCADITILHLCNCLFYDEGTGECSLEHLKSKEKDMSEEFTGLLEFYKKYNFEPFNVTQDMRNDWSRVVQGLVGNDKFECQEGYKPCFIHYLNQQYRNEISPGIINTLSVMSKICDTEDIYKDIMSEDPITKDSIVEKSIKFFNKIANKNIQTTISGDDIEEIKRGETKDFIGDFRITFKLMKSEDSTTMKLYITPGHTSFIFEEMKSERKKLDFASLQKLKPNNNSCLLPSLLKRYINLLDGKDDKTTNFNDTFEALYNQGILQTNEQKRDHLIYLYEYMDKNNSFDHAVTKKVIENIVRSANLSDTAAKKIFSPFFLCIPNLFDNMDDDEKVSTWLSLYNKTSEINSASVRNVWDRLIKNGRMKIKNMNIYGSKYTMDSVRTILSIVKERLLDLAIN